MKMTKEQITHAVNTGLELLGNESSISIPARLNDGTFLLKQLLVQIAQGNIGLATDVKKTPSPDDRQSLTKQTEELPDLIDDRNKDTGKS